jgi:hypothetical protein
MLTKGDVVTFKECGSGGSFIGVLLKIKEKASASVKWVCRVYISPNDLIRSSDVVKVGSIEGWYSLSHLLKVQNKQLIHLGLLYCAGNEYVNKCG